MEREFYYAPPSAIHDRMLRLDGDELHHLVQVRRRRVGDIITVVDGTGTEYEAALRTISRSEAACEILEHRNCRQPELRDLTLAVGILKNPARFDLLIEKGTELGVHSFIPLLTERSVARSTKEARWQKIAVAAMKQSERRVLPLIAPLTPFAQLLAAIPPDTAAFIAHEETATPTLPEVLRSHGRPSMLVCIGPEGGFSADEIAAAQQARITPIGLGPQRLRTETAAITVASLCALL